MDKYCFLIFAKNKGCCYSLEEPQCYMFAIIKKIGSLSCKAI